MLKCHTVVFRCVLTIVNVLELINKENKIKQKQLSKRKVF